MLKFHHIVIWTIQQFQVYLQQQQYGEFQENVQVRHVLEFDRHPQNLFQNY